MYKYRIYVSYLDVLIDKDFDTPSDAADAAHKLLRPGTRFSVHPCIDGDAFAAIHNYVANK